MKEKKKMKLKKFHLHPITVFLLLTILVIILSGILSLFQMQGTYNTVNSSTYELEPKLVAVENMLNFSGLRYLISNSMKNFLSFTPLAMLLISLIGLSVAEATGFIEVFTKRHLSKLSKSNLTFLIIFIATISSLINEIGYAILIPLAALIYFINGRNPMLGIITAFCGVAFGYGVSIFIGSTEVSLMGYTKEAAMLIDKSTHIALSSNLFFIIAASIIISIIGTIIIEKIIAPKLGKYKKDEEYAKTEQYGVIDIEEEEQKRIETEKREKSGLKASLITAIIVIIIFIYMLIPNLPYSGALLDMEEKIYLNQLFGDNSYFQDGFAYMMSILFLLMGLAYAIGSKSIKNDKQLVERIEQRLSKIGSIIVLMFVVSQFISIYKQTNIGTVITIWLVNLLEHLEFSGIPLIILVTILIAISNIFLTTSATKWAIFSPVVVPMFMQSNISPQFAQIVMRVSDSMTNGITPLLAAFSIYIGYLNIYNLNKNKPYGIRKSISLIMPYCLLMSAVWILLLIGWYIIGLPIGPNVYPTI